jgi:hypothetical protein
MTAARGLVVGLVWLAVFAPALALALGGGSGARVIARDPYARAVAARDGIVAWSRWSTFSGYGAAVRLAADGRVLTLASMRDAVAHLRIGSNPRRHPARHVHALRSSAVYGQGGRPAAS